MALATRTTSSEPALNLPPALHDEISAIKKSNAWTSVDKKITQDSHLLISKLLIPLGGTQSTAAASLLLSNLSQELTVLLKLDQDPAFQAKLTESQKTSLIYYKRAIRRKIAELHAPALELKHPDEPVVQFEFSDDLEERNELESRLCNFQTSMKLSNRKWTLSIKKGALLLADLEKEFDSLCEMEKNLSAWLTEDEKLILEEYKLRIIKSVQMHIQNKYVPDLAEEVDPSEQMEKISLLAAQGDTTQLEGTQASLEPVPLSSSLPPLSPPPPLAQKPSNGRLRGYRFEVANIMLMSVIFSFSGLKTSLGFLPFAVPDIISITLGLVLNSFMMLREYAFFSSPAYKSMWGVSNQNDRLLPDIYIEQLFATQKFNRACFHLGTKNIAIKHYERYAEVGKKFNAYMHDVKNKRLQHKETMGAKIINGISTGISLMQAGFGIVSTAKMTLMMISTWLAACFIPVCIVIAYLLLRHVVEFIYVRRSQMLQATSPDAMNYLKAQCLFSSFKQKAAEFDLEVQTRRDEEKKSAELKVLKEENGKLRAENDRLRAALPPLLLASSVPSVAMYATHFKGVANGFRVCDEKLSGPTFTA